MSVGRAVPTQTGPVTHIKGAYGRKALRGPGLVIMLTYIVGSISGKYNGSGLGFWPMRTTRL